MVPGLRKELRASYPIGADVIVSLMPHLGLDSYVVAPDLASVHELAREIETAIVASTAVDPDSGRA